MKNKGTWYILACYILFGVLPIYWKLLMTADPYFIICNRVFWSIAFTVFLLLLKKQLYTVKQVFSDHKTMLKLLLSGILLVVNWAGYIIAVNTDHVIDASLAYYFTPIITILLGRTCFKERLAGLQVVAIFLASVGVISAFIFYGVVPWLALIIGSSFAFYGAVKKTVDLDGITSLTIECLWMLVPAIVLCVWLVNRGQFALPGETLTWWQWLVMPTTGVVTGVPLVIYAKGIQSVSYSMTGILMYINPTLQLLCGVFFFHEPFTRVHAIMFVFVWLSVAVYLFSTYMHATNRSLTQDRKKYRQASH